MGQTASRIAFVDAKRVLTHASVFATLVAPFLARPQAILAANQRGQGSSGEAILREIWRPGPSVIALLASLALLVLSACGVEDPAAVSEDVEDGKRAVTAIDHAKAALQWIGILPSYECGEEQRHFAGKLLEAANAEAGCVAVADETADSSDRVQVSFGEGCAIGKKSLSGNLGIVTSGGDDRKRVELDLTQLRIDGEAIPVSVTYGTCGDEDRYSATVSGTLSDSPRRTFRMDLTVANQEGIVLIGDNTLVLRGGGEVEHPDGTDRVSFDGLSYEIGDVLPKDGAVNVQTSRGKHVKVRFEVKFWHLGMAEICVNDDQPITVPIPQ